MQRQLQCWEENRKPLFWGKVSSHWYSLNQNYETQFRESIVLKNNVLRVSISHITLVKSAYPFHVHDCAGHLKIWIIASFPLIDLTMHSENELKCLASKIQCNVFLTDQHCVQITYLWCNLCVERDESVCIHLSHTLLFLHFIDPFTLYQNDPRSLAMLNTEYQKLHLIDYLHAHEKIGVSQHWYIICILAYMQLF